MRKVVDIRVLNTEKLQMETVGRVIYEDGVIFYENLSKRFIKDLNDFGIIGNPKDGPLFPRDGEKFIDSLHLEYKGSTIRATPARVEK